MSISALHCVKSKTVLQKRNKIKTKYLALTISSVFRQQNDDHFQLFSESGFHKKF